MGIVDGTILDGPEDWIVALLHQQAYLAPFLLLTVEEAGFPLPVPGDLVAGLYKPNRTKEKERKKQ
jgi:hypothetical protein